MNRKIILASSSPRRRELLEKASLVFDVVSSSYEEDMTLPLSPRELVIKLSRGKAEDVAKNQKDAIVIGADLIVACGGKVLGKPHTKEKAKEMLLMLSGNTHSVWTGLTVIDIEGGKTISEAIEVKVTFKRLSEKEIDDYVKTGEPLDKAGAYAIQGIEKNLSKDSKATITALWVCLLKLF